MLLFEIARLSMLPLQPQVCKTCAASQQQQPMEGVCRAVLGRTPLSLRSCVFVCALLVFVFSTFLLWLWCSCCCCSSWWKREIGASTANTPAIHFNSNKLAHSAPPLHIGHLFSCPKMHCQSCFSAPSARSRPPKPSPLPLQCPRACLTNAPPAAHPTQLAATACISPTFWMQVTPATSPRTSKPALKAGADGCACIAAACSTWEVCPTRPAPLQSVCPLVWVRCASACVRRAPCLSFQISVC